MSPRSPAVVIGVPTYRRPRQLAQLLHSLYEELGDRQVPVVVADNECGDAAPLVVAAAARSGLSATCICVRERGISQVRNAIIREVSERHPSWRWLIVLDDDGVVEPGWFDALLHGTSRFDADVVAGPVLGDLPERASVFARNSVYAGRPRFASGPVPMLNGAQNIAIARGVVDRLGTTCFPTSLGTSGARTTTSSDGSWRRGAASPGATTHRSPSPHPSNVWATPHSCAGLSTAISSPRRPIWRSTGAHRCWPRSAVAGCGRPGTSAPGSCVGALTGSHEAGCTSSAFSVEPSASCPPAHNAPNAHNSESTADREQRQMASCTARPRPCRAIPNGLTRRCRVTSGILAAAPANASRARVTAPASAAAARDAASVNDSIARASWPRLPLGRTTLS